MVSRNFFSTGLCLVHINAMSQRSNNFRDRFAYARWLFYGRTGAEPSQTLLAERVNRAQPSVGDWYLRESPPPHWQTHQPFADYLGVDRVWLIEGVGEPPEKPLWEWWVSATSQAGTRQVAEPSPSTGSSPEAELQVPQQRGTKSRGEPKDADPSRFTRVPKSPGKRKTK